MRVISSSIPDVKIVEPDLFKDDRGSFAVTFNVDQFREHGLPTSFVQHNISHSRKGVLRGLHYQIAHPQGKLLHVVAGTIFDVGVDLRRGSPFFGKWTSKTLSANDPVLMWIPPGFAHGFYVLSEAADIVYYVTDRYSREHERTIAWNDPELAIDWPIESGTAPIISAKDRGGARFSEAEVYD